MLSEFVEIHYNSLTVNLKTYKFGCLKGSVLAWTVAANPNDCIEICQTEELCKSVSFCKSSSTCVLHWGNLLSDQIVPQHESPNYQAEVQEIEWDYYEILCNASVCHSEIRVT